jgi:hypothetical protein
MIPANGIRKLGSLGEMIEHVCMSFCGVYENLSAMALSLEQSGNPRAELHRTFKENMAKGVLDNVISEIEKLGLGTALYLNATSVRARLLANDKFSAELLGRELKRLQGDIMVAVYDLKFAYIPPDHAEFFEQEKPFGENVFNAFPSIRTELTAATNCLAADLPTAAVFHLMRAAERGMRILAWDRRVPKIVQNKPLELQDWKTMIEGLEEEAEKITNWPNKLGKVKTQGQEFYNTAIQEFRGFKDAWRNHVMHDRRDFNFEDAKGVLSHVSRFLKLLALRLSENKRTPLIWGKRQLIK